MVKDHIIGYNYGVSYFLHKNLTNRISQQTKELINKCGYDHEISIRVNVESESKILKNYYPHTESGFIEPPAIKQEHP